MWRVWVRRGGRIGYIGTAHTSFWAQYDCSLIFYKCPNSYIAFWILLNNTCRQQPHYLDCLSQSRVNTLVNCFGHLILEQLLCNQYYDVVFRNPIFYDADANLSSPLHDPERLLSVSPDHTCQLFSVGTSNGSMYRFWTHYNNFLNLTENAL